MPTSAKKIVLKSSDGETFEVEEAVALKWLTIKLTIGDDGAISLPNVKSQILSKVIEYCKKHAEHPVSDGDRAAEEDELNSFDTKFIEVDKDTLFDIILAANHLGIKSLLTLSCQTVAEMIRGKTPEEIRIFFNMKKDYTPKEEEVHMENPGPAFSCSGPNAKL